MIGRVILGLVCLLSVNLSSAQQSSKSDPEPWILLQVVAGSSNVSFDGRLGDVYMTVPILQMRDSTPIAPPSYGKCVVETKALREFEQRLIRENYAVYFGGAFVKTARRNAGWTPIWMADLKVNALPVAKDNDGLASNVMDLGHKKSSRRPASKEVQKEFAEIAAQVLARELQLGSDEVKGAKVSRVFEIEIQPDVNAVVGRIALEKAGSRIGGFIIAERENGTLIAKVVDVNRDSRQALTFVDQLDLDRDGVDEIVASKWDWRLGFRVFRRKNAGWSVFYADDRNGDCVQQVYPATK